MQETMMNQSLLNNLDCKALSDAKGGDGENDGSDVAAVTWFLGLENVHDSLEQDIDVFLFLHYFPQKFRRRESVGFRNVDGIKFPRFGSVVLLLW